MEFVTVRACSFAEFEAAPAFASLLAEYGAESSIAGMPPAQAHLETYRKMDEAGFLHLFGAFDGDVLIGFIGMLASLLPHYGRVVATTESFFVGSASRKTGAGMELLRMAEARARTLGAIGFLASAPVGSRLERVMPSAGYRQTNSVFFKSLQ